VPFGARQFEERQAWAMVGGVVHQDVEPAEPVEGGRDDRCASGRVGQIAHPDLGALTDGVGRGPGGVVVDIHDQDTGAFGRQSHRRRPAAASTDYGLDVYLSRPVTHMAHEAYGPP